MRVVSLFSGIEGFGFDEAGMTYAAQAEIDPHCRLVLNRHYPGVPKAEDVRGFGRHSVDGSIDVVVGGFPCQDLSVAGKRAGLAGERSGLWFEFHRVLRELKPRWVVVENVPGLLSSNGGRDFAVVLRGLVELGYGVAWRVLDAQYFGVAQRRRRVFVVGSLGSGRAAQVLFESESGAWDSPPSREAGQGVAPTLESGTNRTGGTRPPGTTVDTAEALFVSENQRAEVRLTPYARQLTTGGGKPAQGYPTVMTATAFEPRYYSDRERMGGAPSDIVGPLKASDADAGDSRQYVAFAFTERTRPDGRTFEAQEEIAYALTNPASGGRTHSRQLFDGHGVRRLIPRECERLQGFPDDWTAWGLDDGGNRVEISDSARYRMLGNAVNRRVGVWIARRIRKVEET